MLKIFLYSVFIWAWVQMSVSAQIISPDELSVQIRKDATERNVDALMDSLSSYDGGNYDLASLRGLTTSVHETHVTFQSVVNDERVRKLYEKLQSLEKSEASKVVTESFDRALADARKSFTQGTDDAKIYGLHAKLWLTFEFGDLNAFNKRVKAWNDYSLQSTFQSRATGNEFPGPELLMYLNLVYLEQKRSGAEGTSVGKLINEVGTHLPFESTLGEYPITAISASGDESEAKKLGQISLIRIWNGLGRLDKLERAKLMRKAGAFIDPSLKPNLSDKLVEYLSNRIQEFGVSKIKAKLPRPKRAIELQFLGSIPPSKAGLMSCSWKGDIAPDKEEFMGAIEFIQKQVHEEERDDWDDCVEEIRLWLADLPDEGIEAKEKRIYFQWPDEEIVSDEIPRIRLSMRGIKALQGSLEKEDSGEGGKRRRGQTQTGTTND